MDVRAGVVRVRRPRVEHALGFQEGRRELLGEAAIGIRGEEVSDGIHVDHRHGRLLASSVRRCGAAPCIYGMAANSVGF